MKTILEINNSLDAMSKYLFKNNTAFEAINLFRKRLYKLSKKEELTLIKKYDENTFPEVLEYIVHSFDFYKKNKVELPTAFKQQLILKYINDFEQVISSSEDLFNYKIKSKSLIITRI